jgi:hypothetical protein
MDFGVGLNAVANRKNKYVLVENRNQVIEPRAVTLLNGMWVILSKEGIKLYCQVDRSNNYT